METMMIETIVITDGFTLNPLEQEWNVLNKFGRVIYFERTSPGEMVDRCKDATIIVTNKTPVSADTIQNCPRLKIIAVTATGFNIVDTGAAAKAGVTVCNVPGYGTNSVAQHTVALLLELTNHVGLNSNSVEQGEWEHCPDFSFTKKPIMELKDKVFGIIGYGHIGQKVGEIVSALGMKVLYYSPSRAETDRASSTVRYIFANSDVVSLHCPLTNDNREFVNSGLIDTMKTTALFINTSRGQLVHETDLASALIQRRIAGAALDVLSTEPPPENHPLLRVPNCIITPHTAWLSVEARKRIMETTLKNIESVLQGTPLNNVS
jgi:glycerate dehydrogenase